jgi:hypothetical protein
MGARDYERCHTEGTWEEFKEEEEEEEEEEMLTERNRWRSSVAVAHTKGNI